MSRRDFDNVDSLHPHRTDCDENQQAILDHNGARVLTQCNNTVGSLVAEFAIRIDGESTEMENRLWSISIKKPTCCGAQTNSYEGRYN